jgi:hypothetical protein
VKKQVIALTAFIFAGLVSQVSQANVLRVDASIRKEARIEAMTMMKCEAKLPKTQLHRRHHNPCARYSYAAKEMVLQNMETALLNCGQAQGGIYPESAKNINAGVLNTISRLRSEHFVYIKGAVEAAKDEKKPLNYTQRRVLDREAILQHMQSLASAEIVYCPAKNGGMSEAR